MGYLSCNIIKWIGIVLIILVFTPVFNYGGKIEPIWAFFVDLNWERGLNLGRFSDSDMEVGIYLAIIQFVAGFLLAMFGSLCARSKEMELGL